MSNTEFVAPSRIRLRSTLAGRLLIPVATAGLVAGWLAGANASSLFTVSAFALLGLSALASRWHLRGLRVRWTGAWVTRVAELKVGTLEVQNSGRLNALQVSVFPGQGSIQSNALGRTRPGARFAELGQRGCIRLAVACSFHARGRITQLPLELVSAFPFGLFEAIASFEPRADVLVLPRTGALRGLERWLPRARSSHNPTEARRAQCGEEEFDRVRELQEGEAARRIHWGLSARADRWIRREFVAEGRGAVEVVLVTQVERMGLRRERDLGFETAVALVATLGQTLVREGAQLRFRTHTSEAQAIVGRRGLRQLGVLLAEARHTSGDPRGALAALENEPRHRHCQRVIVLTGNASWPAAMERLSDGSVVVDADHPDLGRVFRSARTRTGELVS